MPGLGTKDTKNDIKTGFSFVLFVPLKGVLNGMASWLKKEIDKPLVLSCRINNGWLLIVLWN